MKPEEVEEFIAIFGDIIVLASKGTLMVVCHQIHAIIGYTEQVGRRPNVYISRIPGHNDRKYNDKVDQINN